MNVVSFQIFCIEFYSSHIQCPAHEVYQMFQRSGLLEMLSTDYEDLHGLGTEELMQFCDQYLGREQAV